MLVLPNRTAAVWERFLQENKILVYKYIVRQVKRGIEEDKEKIDLFKFEDGSMKAWIPRTHILKFLEDAMKIFVSAEEYEYAAKTNKVIKLYYVDKLIKESTNQEE